MLFFDFRFNSTRRRSDLKFYEIIRNISKYTGYVATSKRQVTMEKNFLTATSTRLSHDTRISGIPQARISPWNCSIEREPRVPLSSSLCSQHFIVPISGSITRERGIDTCRNPTSILLLVKLGERKKKSETNLSNESLFLKFYTDWKKKGGTTQFTNDQFDAFLVKIFSILRRAKHSSAVKE